MQYTVKKCSSFCKNLDGRCAEIRKDKGYREDYCENIDDCTMKNIIKICIKSLIPCSTCTISTTACDSCGFNREVKLAKAILNTLEIEEKQNV